MQNNINVNGIEVVCGSMFSGKTEELLKRLSRAQLAKLNVVVFKPIIDSRYDKNNIVSHNKNKMNCIAIQNADEILSYIKNIDVIGIDEAQFFDVNLINVCNMIANKGKRVIIAGLDMDFLGAPFGIMPTLLAIAERITKLNAICFECGDLANYSFRKNKKKNLIEIGDTKEYQALCRLCFQKKTSKNA